MKKLLTKLYSFHLNSWIFCKSFLFAHLRVVNKQVRFCFRFLKKLNVLSVKNFIIKRFFNKFLNFCIFCCGLLFLSVFVSSSAIADTGAFNDFLNQLYQKSLQQGFSSDFLLPIFNHIHPIARVMSLDEKQAGLAKNENFWFWQPRPHTCMFCYIRRSLNISRVHEARYAYQEDQSLLNAISQKYGVPAEYLVSLWGLESNFGKVQGNFPEFSALATLAYEPRRRAFFEREFFAALHMVRDRGVPIQLMKGSWAGAIGQCQLMPSRYLSLSIDYDNKGYADVWGHKADALASIANYLQQAGWLPNGRVVQAISLPWGFNSSLEGLKVRKPLQAWLRLGVIPREQLTTPSDNRLYSVIVPDDDRQYAFLVDSHNFNVIMDWNHSRSYAISVGLLAREIKQDAEFIHR